MAHTAEPVPLVVSGGPVRPDGSEAFGERACAAGSLGIAAGCRYLAPIDAADAGIAAAESPERGHPVYSRDGRDTGARRGTWRGVADARPRASAQGGLQQVAQVQSDQ